ncbi:uncharacterized protein B0I36DRAFT_366090 [Microdochium trichocladiopsis]|uniref:Autophagy-related protein 1 n=1 Tax=Microdochium trichocladiopsis TaxID=1682393 RepID=A0A9P8Y0M0_9PEZI|nr:uncharacterized protein B0I36DRAFT_366090 [Microdochium trichocladiopsis]KAH7026538.1 hypothetical protein B0I36DRAFT_366090 [Microdochium trichocladiopsis]
MDSTDDSQATQQATQNALDPRRFGKQNSGFTDEDISDIVCLLYPNSENASREVLRFANSSEYSRHTVGRYTADAIDSDLYLEDDAQDFGRTRGLGDHAIVLRLSAAVKDPRMGFAFGRNPGRCDICFANDPGKRVSNVHFRIYVNQHGSVMLEDQSTNGTVVDNKLLRKPDPKRQSSAYKRILESGSQIKIIMVNTDSDLMFLVRIPRRDGDTEAAYLRNLNAYLRRVKGISEEDPNRTIGPGPSGHVNLFPPPFNRAKTKEIEHTPAETMPHIPREWRGGEKYARVGVVGKGAFATVYKVTSKYDGSPYAAKELDKRKFMKNGVLDQKVENEMKIMQAVQHPHIVQYIEHFDWEAHQMIIIMEYVAGGDLGKLILDNGSVVENAGKILADQLTDALGYLHDNKITHRDVKPDNILVHSISPLEVKLTDFGLSKMIDTEQTFLKTFCGTLLYCAPEVYNEFASYDDHGRRTHRKIPRAERERYDHAVDVWSLGGVLFYALTGSPPFPVKNGITYTELLDHIVKHPLNTIPLEKASISKTGIHFLSRMIHVRPETRATISELRNHAWLTSGTESFDEISDEDEDHLLGHGASQLSLDDRPARYDSLDGADSLQEPEPDFSMEYESEKENYTQNQGGGNRLFGEVNNSALGSSGAISEDRLNLPVSKSSFDDGTDAQESEILDSFEDSGGLSTPRQKGPLSRSVSAIVETSANGNTRSVLLGMPSQSLGGASSIFGDLNMASRANVSGISEFTTSKRKPAYDTSDEFESSGSYVKPSMKRLKSQGDTESRVSDDDELALFASVPPIAKNESGRQIDYPLHKTTFWDSSNKDTWHLNYPEMTHLQYNAFELAAERRKEEFGPGRSPLWELAMRHFPPTTHHAETDKLVVPDATRPALLKRDSRTVDEDWDIPPTAPVPSRSDDEVSIPDTLSIDHPIPAVVQTLRTPRTTVATFRSAQGSLVPNISFNLQDPVISWGRERSNTTVYQPATESKIPKNAFRILLWREGYTGSTSDFRPWDAARSTSSRTMRASPEPDTFAFYISTKATNGLRINNNPLQPNEPKEPLAPSRYWMKLHHGDIIVFWGSDDVTRQAKLRFDCHWGGSSAPRPADEPPTCVPEATARKLDRLWPKALETLNYDRIKADAHADQDMRMRHMAREQERGRLFEQKRAEAVRILALRATMTTVIPSSTTTSASASRQTSPGLGSFGAQEAMGTSGTNLSSASTISSI